MGYTRKWEMVRAISCRCVLAILCHFFIAIADVKCSDAYFYTMAPDEGKTFVFTDNLISAVKANLTSLAPNEQNWSLCLWIKTWNKQDLLIHIVYRNRILHLGCLESNQFYIEVEGSHHPVSLSTSCSGYWQYVCFNWDEQGKQVTVFENGLKAFVANIRSSPPSLLDDTVESIELRGNGTSLLPSLPASYLFSTQISQLNIWNSLQDERIVKLLAECSDKPTDGNVLSWSKGEFDLIQIGITGSQMCSDLDCYTSLNGKDYFGRFNVTEKGYACQQWTQQLPNPHLLEHYSDSQRILLELSDNFCRNPDYEPRPWCFTTNSNALIDYCEVGQKKQYCTDTYVFYHDKLTWPEAQKFCISTGGTLAYIDKDIQIYLNSFITDNQLNKYDKNYWFGLSNNENGDWLYPDGIEATYFNWESEDSNSPIPGTNCAMLGKNEDYKWIKNNCTHLQGYICEYFPGRDYAELYGSNRDSPMTSSGSVRISGGLSPFGGFLEVLDNRDNYWKYVCNSTFEFIEATVVCNELGFMGALSSLQPASIEFFENSESRFYGNNVQCIGKEKNIKECQIDVFSLYSANYACDPAWISCQFPGYLGCFSNSKLGSESILPGPNIQSCLEKCRRGQIAMLTNGNQCSCEKEVNKEDQVDDSLCSTPCSGDDKHICGGGSLYSSAFNASLIGSCNGTWTNMDSFTLYSPNYPGNYQDSLSCQWEVSGVTGTHALRLNFTMLSLGPGDTLQALFPSTSSQQPINFNNSTSLPLPFTIINTQVKLKFHSDSMKNDQGFILKIEALKFLCNSSHLVTSNTELTLEDSYYPGDQVNVSCTTGYQICGSPVLTCLDTGYWDQVMPVCYSINSKSKFFNNTTALVIGVTFFITCLTVCFLFAVLYTWLKRRQHRSEEPLGTNQTRDSKNNYTPVPVVQMSSISEATSPSNTAAATTAEVHKYEPVEDRTYVNVDPSHSKPATSATQSIYEVPEQRKEPEPNYQPLIKNQRT